MSLPGDRDSQSLHEQEFGRLASRLSSHAMSRPIAAGIRQEVGNDNEQQQQCDSATWNQDPAVDTLADDLSNKNAKSIL